MNNDDVYTFSERTNRKYTVYQAVQSAERLLKGKVPMCTNAISGRQYSDKITLKELNEIADRLHTDSLYYAGQL